MVCWSLLLGLVSDVYWKRDAQAPKAVGADLFTTMKVDVGGLERPTAYAQTKHGLCVANSVARAYCPKRLSFDVLQMWAAGITTQRAA